jgi:hypothetical protein
VNATRYLAMLQHRFLPALDQHGLHPGALWLQQDGARPHTAARVLTFLNQTFPHHLISKGGAVAWPPRSPDLTFPDFFLWGAVRTQVYATSVPSVSELKRRIRRAVRAVTPETLHALVDALQARCRQCIAVRGSHVEGVHLHH